MGEGYRPQVGQTVRGYIQGRVTSAGGGGLELKSDDGATRYVCAALYTWERLPDPEPEWQGGDIVVDASGVVWHREPCGCSGWLQAGSASVFPDKVAKRPLTLLVRDGKAVSGD